MQLSYYTVLLLSASILIPAIIGVIRLKEVGFKYRPFIYLIWVGAINEVVCTYCAYKFHNNIIPYVIYSLLECFFLLWLFKRLNVFGKKHWVLYNLAIIFFCIWLFENFFSHRFGERFTYYFDIIYSFSVVLLSIHALNHVLATETEILKNPTFLICIGFIIFFSYEIIEIVFWMFGLANSAAFRKSVQTILFLTNFLTNLIFGLAVLWMKKKQGFTRQF